MEAVTYTCARQNMARLMDEVVNNNEVKIITRNNNPSVVMMSLDEYNSLKETEYIMSSEQTMNEIRQGEEDLKAGKGIEVNLDEL